MQKTIEQEFKEQVFRHKSAVVLGVLLHFYKEQYNTGVNIPEFLDNTPQEKAKRHYFELLNNEYEFDNIYNKCWEKIRYVLP